MTAKETIELLTQAAIASRSDQHRQGNVLRFSDPAEIIMTGDLHGAERNFQRLLAYADLGNNPGRHLVIQELLHGGDSEHPEQCHSYRLVTAAARVKTQSPNQLHILLGNHAVAQVTGEEVLKGGQPMVRALNAGLDSQFNDSAPQVRQALEDFVLSMALAARTETGVWMSHSLPSLRNLKSFDDSIFETPLSLEGLRGEESLHALLWDRAHTDKSLDELRGRWGVENFIVGHQPQSSGHSQPKPGLIILASDHPHGAFLHFDLKKSYDSDALYAKIRMIAELA